MTTKLDIEIEKAKLACENFKCDNCSIIERLKPWVHYNNLLIQKIYKEIV